MKSPTGKSGRYGTLLAWRRAHKLTQREAGEIIGYSLPGYNKLENGVTHPRGPALKRVHMITGVPVEVLAGVA